MCKNDAANNHVNLGHRIISLYIYKYSANEISQESEQLLLQDGVHHDYGGENRF